MKLFLILLIITSCAQIKSETAEKKIYYITIDQQGRNIVSGKYEKEIKLDSVRVESDSLAFWEGVTTFTASKMADKMIIDRGVKPPTITLDFDVLDSDGVSILNKIPDAEMEKAKEYVRSHLRN